MARKNGSVDALVKHLKDNNIVSVEAAQAFLKSRGATGNGSSTIHHIVCELKAARRAKLTMWTTRTTT
jgi:hypothetical protein